MDQGEYSRNFLPGYTKLSSCVVWRLGGGKQSRTSRQDQPRTMLHGLSADHDDRGGWWRLSTAIPTPAVAFTGAVQPEFCNTRQRRRSMLAIGSATTAARSLRRHTRLFFGMRRSEPDRRRRRPLLKRGSSSLRHRLVLAYHSCRGEAYDQITAGTLLRAGPSSLNRQHWRR